jgi:hypothetical protein
VIGVNLAEFFNVTQRVIEPMFKQGTGNVANITTSLITTPSLGHPPCRLRSTKGGLALA